MNSQDIQEAVYNWALDQNFTAPYGVLEGTHTNKKGTKYRSVTFGYARTLDVTVEIYNKNWILMKSSTNGSEIFSSYDNLMQVLNDRYDKSKSL